MEIRLCLRAAVSGASTFGHSLQGRAANSDLTYADFHTITARHSSTELAHPGSGKPEKCLRQRRHAMHNNHRLIR